MFFVPIAQASMYAPGATLDPDCGPTDSGCGVSSNVATGVIGQTPYYAASGAILAATSTLTILANGNVGIGTTTPGNKVTVDGNSKMAGHLALGVGVDIDTCPTWWWGGSGCDTPSALMIGEDVIGDLSVVANGNATIFASSQYTNTGTNGWIYGLDMEPLVSLNSTGNLGLFYGATIKSINRGSGTIVNQMGLDVGTVANGNSAQVDNSYGVRSLVQVTAGHVNDAYDLYARTIKADSGTIDNSYGLYVYDHTGVGTSRSWNIYSAGSGSQNIFDGLIGIGTTTPQRALTIASSTAAQLMLTDASLTSSAWNLRSVGNYLYFASSSPVTFATTSIAALTISPNGYVGIGTTNPNSKLQVAGLVNFDDTLSNIALGTTAISGTPSGLYNIGFGTNALRSLSSGSNNIAVGWNSGYYNSTGINNIYIGKQAGQSGTSAQSNTAIGVTALLYNQTGAKSVAIGTSALINSNSVLGQNTALGYYSMWDATTAYYNTAVGYKASEGLTTGVGNTSLGFDSMLYNNNGAYNVALGLSALRHTATSSYNVAVGAQADYLAPAAVTATVAEGTGLGAGTYSYRVSYVLDGVETTLGTVVNDGNIITTAAANPPTPAMQKVELSNIPTYSGPKTCTARKIYRTVVNGTGSGDGEGQYYLLTTINDNVTTVFTDTTPDGSLTAMAKDTEPSGSIMLGFNAKAIASGQMVVGSGAAPISQVFIGAGVYDTTPPEVTINATGGQGSDVLGAGLTFASGISTGSAVGAPIAFKTSAPGAAGTDDNGLATRMIITGTGLVGIGTTSPDMLLSVGSSTPVGAVAHFENSTGSCYINPTGGDISCTSDERLKLNINALTDISGLAALVKLRPVTFNWKNGETLDAPTHTGFIAQEVQTIFPDLVYQAPDGYLTMNYAGLTPYLVKAVQELATQVRGFAESITTAVLNATTVRTQQLCVGSTCIDESQMKALLNQAGQQAAVPTQTDTPASAPEPTAPEPAASSTPPSDGAAVITTETTTTTPDTPVTIVTSPPDAAPQPDLSVPPAPPDPALDATVLPAN